MKKYLLILALVTGLITIVFMSIGDLVSAGLPMMGFFLFIIAYSRSDSRYQKLTFTLVVFVFLAAAMYYPFLFTDWGFNTKVLVIPMLQLIMFGMGTKLSLSDFRKELQSPKGIIIGSVMAFGIMPFLGLLVAKAFAFPPEIAVGVILIGACPGGAASNVMAFLARGNVALSVSVTTVTTLLTPVVTPALMKLLANEFLEISFLKMMFSSFNLIIVPIIAGLICHKILYSNAPWLQKNSNVLGLGALFTGLTLIVIWTTFPSSLAVLKPGLILAMSLAGVVSFTSVLVKTFNGPEDWMNKILPTVSMVSIVLFVTIVVALNRDKLLEVGLLLVAASAVHNFFGFVLGYWGGRLAGLSILDSRTLSIEVALKNGGLGMGLALEALGNANAALAPIVFGKWMNISGSAIANYWRDKPTGEEAEESKKVQIT